MTRIFLLLTILLIGFSPAALIAADSPDTAQATFAVY